MERYSVDIDKTIDSLANCIKRLNNGIEDTWDWSISVNGGDIYFNFDLDNKELVISDEPYYDDSLCLNEIIEMINEETED